MNFLNNLQSVFIIAELSANHNGSKQIAMDSIKAAKRAGADAIKLQTYTPDTITINSQKKDFQINNNTIWDGQTLYDLYYKAYTPWEWHLDLFNLAKKEGILCFSTPFDKTAVDFLEELNNPIYKIASFEITDIPLIEYIAKKNKPIIISSGIADYKDIKLAIKTIRKFNDKQLALLKCTSSYPAPINEANLKMIIDFKEKFNVVTGISDHTKGIIAPIVSTALGGKVIEKHFIIDKKIGGPDSTFSLDEKEFKLMVNSVRDTEKSLGKINYNLTTKQKQGRYFARSLYASENIRFGEKFSEKNIKSIRPGFGLHPKFYNKLIGVKSKREIEKGDRLIESDLD